MGSLNVQSSLSILEDSGVLAPFGQVTSENKTKAKRQVVSVLY